MVNNLNKRNFEDNDDEHIDDSNSKNISNQANMNYHSEDEGNNKFDYERIIYLIKYSIFIF